MNIKYKFNIDKLEITYTMDSEVKAFYENNEDATITLGADNDVTLKRIIDPHLNYAHVYEVHCCGLYVGKFYWQTAHNLRLDCYLLVDNTLLYNKNALGGLCYIGQALGVEFKGISKLDVCFDTNLQLGYRFIKLLRDTSEQIILNGKGIVDRDELLPQIKLLSIPSLNNPNKEVSFYVENKNASRGLKGYDKMKEIESRSNKQYILENLQFGSKRVYRLEVSLTTHKEIKAILNKIGISEEYLYLYPFDKSDETGLDTLGAIFVTTLNSLIRLKADKHIKGHRNILEYLCA